MFTHDQVWHGIDRLARERGLTASGLARRAGLDPTTFNPSKRVTKQSKPRWPSTESLAKILNATETSLDAFVALMADRPVDAVPVPSHRLRCIAHGSGGSARGVRRLGLSAGSSVGRDRFPEPRRSARLCARGPRRRPPAHLPRRRSPDRIARGEHPAAGPRDPEDRAGPILAGMLLRRTAQRIEVAPFANDLEAQVLPVREVAWLVRILWVSQ